MINVALAFLCFGYSAFCASQAMWHARKAIACLGQSRKKAWNLREAQHKHQLLSGALFLLGVLFLGLAIFG